MRILVNNIYSQIEPEDGDKPEIITRLRTRFDTYAPGFQFTRQYKTYRKTHGAHGWNGKVNLFTHGQVLTGLLPEVLDLCKKNKVTVNLIDRRIIHQVTVANWTVNLRDYQYASTKIAIENLLQGWWWPRGIIHIATGGGKTEVAAAMLQMLDVPSVFLVHRKDLLHQASARFNQYNIPVGICGDGNWNPQRVTVATFQSIMAKAKTNPSALGFLRQAEQVFFDEAHHIAASSKKGNMFVDLAAMMPNAFMRWGLTGTPFIKDKYSNLLLQGVTGKVLNSVSTAWLIEKGYLATPTVYMIRVRRDDTIPKKWPHCYEAGIVHNKKRNLKIAEEIIGCDSPCLVLVERIEHGSILHDLTGVPFISGKDDTATRAKITNELRAGKHQAAIATTIYDEGIDIPELKTLIIAGGGKSPVRGRQRIGRGLRKAFGKNTVKVVDFMDTSRVLWLHARQRRTTWLEEGFEVREIGSNENTYNTDDG